MEPEEPPEIRIYKVCCSWVLPHRVSLIYHSTEPGQLLLVVTGLLLFLHCCILVCLVVLQLSEQFTSRLDDIILFGSHIERLIRWT